MMKDMFLYTTKLRSGRVVNALTRRGHLHALQYMNRAEAERRAAQVNFSFGPKVQASVWQSPLSHVFYVQIEEQAS